jgi:hypothetical protein
MRKTKPNLPSECSRHARVGVVPRPVFGAFETEGCYNELIRNATIVCLSICLSVCLSVQM